MLSSTDATVPLEPFFQFPGEQLGIVYPRKMPLENIIRNMYKHVHKRFCVAVTSECIKPKGVSVQVYGEPLYTITDEFLEQLTPNVQQIVCDSEFTPGKVPLANTYKGHRFVFSYAFLA